MDWLAAEPARNTRLRLRYDSAQVTVIIAIAMLQRPGWNPGIGEQDTYPRQSGPLQPSAVLWPGQYPYQVKVRSSREIIRHGTQGSRVSQRQVV